MHAEMTVVTLESSDLAEWSWLNIPNDKNNTNFLVRPILKKNLH